MFPNQLVCQITRGVCPAQAIVDAVEMTFELGEGAEYHLISGLPLVEAKNQAVSKAREIEADLIMIEDDILADRGIWERILTPAHTVRIASTRCRNGILNVKYDARGDVLSAGNVMIAIPLAVLERLPKPVFVANSYGLSNDGSLFLRGPNAQGRGSDTHFFYQLAQLDPRPRVEVVGEVTHLMHPLNSERWDLQTPCDVTAA